MNMKATEDHHQRVAQLTFASVYPHYCTKVLKHQRSLDELHQVIHWLTGFDPKELEGAGFANTNPAPVFQHHTQPLSSIILYLSRFFAALCNNESRSSR